MCFFLLNFSSPYSTLEKALLYNCFHVVAANLLYHQICVPVPVKYITVITLFLSTPLDPLFYFCVSISPWVGNGCARGSSVVKRSAGLVCLGTQTRS